MQKIRNFKNFLGSIKAHIQKFLKLNSQKINKRGFIINNIFFYIVLEFSHIDLAFILFNIITRIILQR
jgi:hypothetical protein